LREMIQVALRQRGYEVIEAANGAVGVEQARKELPDLVLCDVSMEEMDGFTFCQKVRENENHRILPFVFVTAKTSLEDKSKALESGGDDIITKPFDVNELILKVQALLRKANIYKVYGAKKDLQQNFKQEIPKVLLVDDDISLARLFHYNLTKEGLECEVANNVKEAFEKIKIKQPDIIVSDIMMPEIDGFNFRKMLLENEELKSIPFIFLSAKGEEKDILDGYDLGINDYVIKTAGPRVLVAKVNTILKTLGKERQKIVSELREAADSLRAKVVPDKTPTVKGFEIKQWHQPFQGIPGGDFIDYFPLDNDCIAVILGDVMGKKWGAWYFAFAYASYVRSAIRVVLQTGKDYSPEKILQQVNKSVYEDAKVSEVFATLSIVLLNFKERFIQYTGAGDLPLLYRDSKTGEVKNIKSKGLLLGFAETGNYESVKVNLNKDDIIVLITDGIIESRNSLGDQFGSLKLIEVISNLSPKDDPLEKIKEEFFEFTSSKFEDDVSLITIKVV
ncbi:MAG: response regulator, partial [Ignavibacteriaceae bacterium]